MMGPDWSAEDASVGDMVESGTVIWVKHLDRWGEDTYWLSSNGGRLDNRRAQLLLGAGKPHVPAPRHHRFSATATLGNPDHAVRVCTCGFEALGDQQTVSNMVVEHLTEHYGRADDSPATTPASDPALTHALRRPIRVGSGNAWMTSCECGWHSGIGTGREVDAAITRHEMARAHRT